MVYYMYQDRWGQAALDIVLFLSGYQAVGPHAISAFLLCQIPGAEYWRVAYMYECGYAKQTPRDVAVLGKCCVRPIVSPAAGLGSVRITCVEPPP